MAVTYGFYNSLNGDRKYDATDMSAIFDGIINDGIFMSIGDALTVKSEGGLNLNVGIGRAWFDHTWTYNYPELPLELESGELVLNRIDAVILDIDSTETARINDIKIIKGEPGTVPNRPTLIKSMYHNQYALAYISVPRGAVSISQANITNMVGTTETPFVTGILKTLDVTPLITQWQTEWYEWVNATQLDNKTWTDEQRAEFLAWSASQRESFDIWFDAIKDELGDNVVGNLQNQIDKIAQDSFDRYYGMVIKNTSITTAENGDTKIIETFSDALAETNIVVNGDVTNIVTNLTPSEGQWNYVKTVVITDSLSGTQISENYSKNPK